MANRNMQFLLTGSVLVYIILYVWIYGTVGFGQDKTDIICDAGTEKLVSEPHEYPAWTLECRDTHHRIIIID